MNDFIRPYVCAGLTIALLLFIFFPVILPSMAKAQEVKAEIEEIDLAPANTQAPEAERPGAQDEPPEKSRNVVGMPILLSNPTIGTGLGLSGMYLYQVDEASRPSNTMITGFYTDSDSWAAGLRQSTWFKDNRFRLDGILGYYDLHVKFFGIGNEAGDRDESIPLQQTGVFVMPDFLMRVREHLYAGVRYRGLWMQSDFDLSSNPDAPPELPDSIETDAFSSGIGLLGQYDSRDNEMNPSQGSFATLDGIFMGEALGSDFSYQIYSGEYNYYKQLGAGSILAYRFSGKITAGDTPYYDLCSFGSRNDLRGYVGGQYRDEMMYATQLEYRWQFYKRLGLVAFGGVGQVAPDISAFFDEPLLPGIGAGLRFMASPKMRVNISIDYAVGKESDGLYFRIGEAF